MEVFEVLEPAAGGGRVGEYPPLAVEGQHAWHVGAVVRERRPRAEGGGLEPRAHVRGDPLKEPYLARTEVRGVGPADEVHPAPKTPAVGEEAAHLVGEAQGL